MYVVHKLCFSLITFNSFMWLGKCKYICIQVCIYKVMFVLPTSCNALYRYTNDGTIQLHEKDPDIITQKVSLLGQMVNLGTVCLKFIQHYVSFSAVRIFQHDSTREVEKGNFNLDHFFLKIALWCKWAIQVFSKQRSGVGGNSPKLVQL